MLVHFSIIYLYFIENSYSTAYHTDAYYRVIFGTHMEPNNA
jgi:hypothetical protein